MHWINKGRVQWLNWLSLIWEPDGAILKGACRCEYYLLHMYALSVLGSSHNIASTQQGSVKFFFNEPL